MQRLFFLCLACLAACSAEKGIMVHNSPPAVTITEPVSGASFDEGEGIALVGQAEDAETSPEDLILTWASDLDGIIDDETRADSDGRISGSTASLSPGTHALQLTAIDAGGLNATTFTDVFIVNVHQSPDIAIHNPDPDASEPTTGAEDVPFDFEAVVSDVQDSPTALIVWVSLDDGTSLCHDVPDGSGFSRCDAVLDVGEHVIVFVVEDSDGNTEQAEVDLEVVAGIYIDDDEDGFTEAEGDCDDDDDDIHPGAPEIYNGIDDDCDGEIDEGTDGYDDDGDGWSNIEGDCDDGDATTYPGASELPDGFDNDCDGIVDEGTDRFDDDGDCYCEVEPCSGTVALDCDELLGDDCDDTDEHIHPDSPEICDTIDNDCDGDIDAADSDTDFDGDGWTICSGDCNDADPGIHPAATEVCDHIDNDCDGTEDGPSAEGAEPWYEDLDGDGYGERTSAIMDCWGPAGYVEDDTDCDDTAVDIFPGAEEYCDGRDNDCDGFTDETGSAGCSTWYRDYDDDGYGSTVSACLCAASDPYTSSNDDDCYDSNSLAYPGGTIYYSSSRGDGSFDYNCNSVEEREFTSVSSGCAFFSDFCGGTEGWSGSAASCGSSGTWNSGCHYSASGWPWDWGCYWNTASKTQNCR